MSNKKLGKMFCSPLNVTITSLEEGLGTVGFKSEATAFATSSKISV